MSASLLPQGDPDCRVAPGQYKNDPSAAAEAAAAKQRAAMQRQRAAAAQDGASGPTSQNKIREGLLDLVKGFTPITDEATSDDREQTLEEAERNEEHRLQRELITRELEVWDSVRDFGRIPDLATKNKASKKVRAMLGDTYDSMVLPRNLGIDPNHPDVIKLLNKLRNDELKMIGNSSINWIQRACMRLIQIMNSPRWVTIPGEPSLAVVAVKTFTMAGALAPLAPVGFMVGGLLFQALARKTTIVMVPYGKENMRTATAFKDPDDGTVFIHKSTYSGLRILINANNSKYSGKDAAKRKVNLYKGRVFGEKQALKDFVSYLREHRHKVEKEAARLANNRHLKRLSGLSAGPDETPPPKVKSKPVNIKVGWPTPPCEPSPERSNLSPEQRHLFDLLLNPIERDALKDALRELLRSPELLGTSREVLDKLHDLAESHDGPPSNTYQEKVLAFVQKTEHGEFISSNFKSAESEDDYEEDPDQALEKPTAATMCKAAAQAELSSQNTSQLVR